MNYRTTRELRSATNTERVYQVGETLTAEDVEKLTQIHRLDYLVEKGALVPEDGPAAPAPTPEPEEEPAPPEEPQEGPDDGEEGEDPEG